MKINNQFIKLLLRLFKNGKTTIVLKYFVNESYPKE